MTLDASRWAEVEAALEAALQVPRGEREALLRRLAAGDEALRREVESLLGAHDAADDFLETSAENFARPFVGDLPDDPALDEVVGSTIGRYTVRRELGRGGFGRVYLADRADGQFEQRVALKLVKRGMDTDEIVGRFLRERQILARLEHANIARLLDGGVSDDGRPYFVMEYVEGLPITEHCDRRRLSVDARLRLFATVCRAVQYAHRNLVVHRDIKPTNVLVTEAGEVKLLDFGIAKVLDEGDSAATVARGPNVGLMTPDYASPEQIAGNPVTTVSDVYQLGVLLYELLTGHRPHTGMQGDRLAVLRSILEVEPRRPSTVLGHAGEVAIAARSGAGVDRLRRRLKGDLDGIVLKALRKEPDRRYPSAEDLAGDIERHLAHLPVHVGAGAGFVYHAGKFVRRHRLLVGAGAFVALLSLGFGAFYTARMRTERDRARREADKALEGARLLRGFFRSWDPDASDRGAVSAAQVLAGSARQAERELHEQPETLAATLSVLGDLNTSIGEMSTADGLIGRAQAIQERLPDSPGADLAATLARRGRLQLERGDLRGAESAYRRSLDLHRALLGASHPETLVVESDLAGAIQASQRLGEAEALFRDVVARLASARNPQVLEAKTNLGYALFLQARYPEAVAILRPTLASCRATYGAMHPLTLRTMRSLASSLRNPNELGEAEALGRESHRLMRGLYGDERAETTHSAMWMAVFFERKGDFEEAEHWARTTSPFNETHPLHVETALHLRTLGGIRMVRGDRVEAEALLRRGLAILRQLFPAGTHPDQGDILNRLALLVVERGARDADEIYAQAVAFERARKSGPFFVTDGYECLARAAQRRGDRQLAETLYRRAVTLYGAELPEGHPYRAAARSGLADLTASAPPLRAEARLRP